MGTERLAGLPPARHDLEHTVGQPGSHGLRIGEARVHRQGRRFEKHCVSGQKIGNRRSMTEMDGKIIRRDHRCGAKRMAAHQSRMRPVIHERIPQIPFSVGKCQIELGNHRCHFKAGLA